MQKYILLILILAISNPLSSQVVMVQNDTTQGSFQLKAKNYLPCTFSMAVTFGSDKKQFQESLPKNSERVLIDLPADSVDSVESFIEKMDLSLTLGNPNAVHDPDYQYQLPYPRGKSHLLIQGNNTDFTHNNITNKYAYDFQMGEGSLVSAARGGIVGYVRNNFKVGDNDKELLHKGNKILICHDDGTIAAYGHLKHKGTTVEIGDHVYAGQVIALSGNTGFSTIPHLHFAVMIGNRSIPVQFKDLPETLVEGRYYKQKFNFTE